MMDLSLLQRTKKNPKLSGSPYPPVLTCLSLLCVCFRVQWSLTCVQSDDDWPRHCGSVDRKQTLSPVISSIMSASPENFPLKTELEILLGVIVLIGCCGWWLACSPNTPKTPFETARRNSVSVPSLDKCEGRVRNDKIQILVEEEYGLVGCWTKELAYDTNTQPPTMQFWDPCPGTSTPAHISCQVTSVGYMIGLGEVSWWFHLKPLEVMTHTLFYKVMWRVTW